MVKYILQNKLLQYPHVNEQLSLQLLYQPYLKMFSSKDQLFNFITESICGWDAYVSNKYACYIGREDVCIQTLLAEFCITG